jgi:hypothetical protein
MKFWDGVLAQNLAECQRKDAVVLSWKKSGSQMVEASTL